MTEHAFPELFEEPLSLALDRRGRAGEPAPPGPPLEGRVLLGGPLSVPVTPEYVAEDRDMALFVEQEAARAVYHVVHLAVTMATEPVSPRLDHVQIDLELSTSAGAGGNGGEPPLAWSMAPLKVTEETEIGTTFKLGPQLRIAQVQGSLGEVSRTRTGRRTVPLLEATGELSPEPRWVLRGTKGVPLSGSQRLVVVIRVPVGSRTRVVTSVRAAVVKGSILRKYVRQLPEPLSLSTVV
ncbi:hypothetical protein [Streptomyces spongiae]|uniref:Uncharacterized protein n=1 Tax=Streptomyces spongiae TaxID=565072 RepID=A0A5N8XLV8_9ACTN|nr:hypothetical protein [Streptomyces spongiae]MPY60433.1 hypothetical protein [Streptomyces spongiae]